jgi:parvulin-like peptidyl-prolyl isomerase
MNAIIVLFSVIGLGNSAQPDVAARVNSEPVPAAEAAAEFRLAYGDREFAEADRRRLVRAALDQVIDRRLVLAYLAKNQQAASKADIDLALAQFEKELKAQNLTLAQHCEKVGLTVDDVRRSLAWKLSWKRYCDQYLTPQNLEKYFERYRREFDGSQLRVAQILFKLPTSAHETSAAAAKNRAAQLKQDIAGGKISFADAAKQNSEAPSRESGGDIGWIERHRPMPDDFSRVAFALKKGDVSEPFVSLFGVHLVTVLDEKPGTKTWRDAESELRPAVTLYLFRWIADKERAAAKIEYAEVR